MAAVQPKPTSVGETFDPLSPATDEVVGTYPVHSAEDVQAAGARARVPAQGWGGGGRAAVGGGLGLRGARRAAPPLEGRADARSPGPGRGGQEVSRPADRR